MLNILSTNNSQTLNLGANAAVTSAVIPALSFKISSQVGVHIAIGTAPTATTSSVYIAAGHSPEIAIPMNNKVSVLNATATADAKVTVFY